MKLSIYSYSNISQMKPDRISINISLIVLSFVLLLNLDSIPKLNNVEDPNQSFSVYLPLIKLYSEDSWVMAGANPQRTSWVPEGVSGVLRPIWYRAIDAYIPRKVQIITANNLLYVATAKGLLALHTTDGSPAWIYPTDMPLGNSPTLENGYLYVGGYDRKIHAINALTGKLKTGWQFYEAGAGYETNPVVINGIVYAGNRDGYFYALDANNGTLRWRYKTGGSILFSAAYQDNTLYFASNDSHAYALNASNGQLIWKSAKLPGAGFHSWWPVIWDNYVIFAGSNNYRVEDEGWTGDIGYDNFVTTQELYDLFPNRENENRNTLIGARGTQPYRWVDGTVTVDNSRTVQYYESYPWRRTFFILDQEDGSEFTFDSDRDNILEYAPFSWGGITHSGNRYPPVVGADGVLYQSTLFRSDPYIGGVGLVGWKFGTPFISIISSMWQAADEPEVWSAGGNFIYLNICCDRQTLGIDISTPNTSFPTSDGDREYSWYAWNLEDLVPGYNSQYWESNGIARFGNVNGVYGDHGVQNPAIPYQGKAYMHRGNSIIAWGNYSGAPHQYPMINVPEASTMTNQKTKAQVAVLLAEEVSKILTADGLLRPGYHHTGLYEATGFTQTGPNLSDYFHNPSDTVITLINALPHLSSTLQQQVSNYIQRWVCEYPLENIAHIGWNSGTYNVTCNSTNYVGRYGLPREIFDTPPEIASQMEDYSASIYEDPVGWNNSPYWNFPPISFYGMWKYSQQFGNARANFDAIKSKPLENTLPDDDYLMLYPYILNAYISGYYGYMQLEKLAGDTTDISQSALYPNYQYLLNLRLNSFSKDTPFTNPWPINDYRSVLNISRNYMFMVPELAEQMRLNVFNEVQNQMDEIDYIAPYWFVSKYDSTRYEGILQQLYDYHSIFQARALILEAPYDELIKYLDVPAFDRGDLFYINNLISTLEAEE